MVGKYFVVIVLYKVDWPDVLAREAVEQAVEEGFINVLIYDNTADSQKYDFFQVRGVTYYHDPVNSGLAKAYNKALSLMGSSMEWLLLLDQDTQLSFEYLRSFVNYRQIEKVAAIVPRVFSGMRQISPANAERYIDRKAIFLEAGVYDERVMAINSGALINTIFLRKVGGFNEAFPLDFLDHWVFWEIHRNGWKVEVIPLMLEHQLSVLDYSNMDHSRYVGILRSEENFYLNYDTTQLVRHKRQLFFRVCKQFFTVKDRFFWKCTLKHLFYSEEVSR